MTPKYDIMHSLVPLFNNYFVTMNEDDTLFKVTCQHYNCFVTCKGSSGELLYITFPHTGFSTIVLYTEGLDHEIFYFQ